MTQGYRIAAWAHASGLEGDLTPAPDKSISHRALMLASIASGDSEIQNLLLGEDVLCTRRILEALGIAMIDRGGIVHVTGNGLRGFTAPRDLFYCGNSGTTMRLMLGLLAAQPFTSRLTGDASLNRRPMGRVIDPLRQMGAVIEEEQGPKGRVLAVRGAVLTGICYASPIASAQVKSAVLLAGLYASERVSVTEPQLSRDHTERFLKSMGAPLTVTATTVTLRPMQGALRPLEITVPGDPSAAAFFVVAALLVPNSHLSIHKVCLNPTRIAFLEVLKRMGGKISVRTETTMAGEPVGTIEVKSSPLTETDIDKAEIPWLIDEIPILSVAAARAQGTTRIRGAEELRVKESDRLKTIARLLHTLGVTFTEYPDGLDIEGRPSWQGGTVDSGGDHRIAMSASIAGLLCKEGMQVHDTACIATSFPNFLELLTALGTDAHLLVNQDART